MKLRPISFLILGMVRHGVSSGYAIKQAADVATRNVWPVSLAQVYPELSRLEQGGLVTRRDDPRGARERSAYEITETGEAALLTWLNSTVEVPMQVRSEGFLRLFFADILPIEEQLSLVRRLQERYRSMKDHLYDNAPQSELESLADAGIRYPLILIRMGERYYDSMRDNLAELEAELEAEEDAVEPPH